MHGKSLSVVFLMFVTLAAGIVPLHGQSRGPLLEITPAPVDFDTVFCGSSRCLEVVFRNSGDTALTIQSLDQLESPFSGGLATPATLLPGETLKGSWCYTPTRVLTRDSISVELISDNRIPYSFGLLVDGSDTMLDAFPGAPSAIAAAHDALTGFVATMMEDGSPQHEGAVFAYSTSSQFRLLRGLSEQRALVEGAIPGTASGAHACVWAGMDRSISLLQSARHRRVLIVINGSSDAGIGNCGPYSSPGITNAAQAADMIVYSISLNGALTTELGEISAATGGLHFDAASTAELGQAIHDIMLHMQRAIRQSIVVRGEVVSPSLAFTPASVLFPTTLAGDTARETVWIHNVGTSPMETGAISSVTGEFSFSFTPRQLMPGDSLPAVASFFPTTQGYQIAHYTVDINGCDPNVPQVSLRGLSYMPVNPTPGPVFSQGDPVIDYGDKPCQEYSELAVPLRNVGNVPMQAFFPIIQSMNLDPPSESQWNVGAGSESSIDLMLRGGRRPGPDSATVMVSVLTRLSTSTMVVIDGSSALRMPWLDIDGTGASRLIIGTLMSSLSSTPELDDRMGVLSASMNGTQTLMPMTNDRGALAQLLPAAGNSDTTALLAAIGQALDTLAQYDGYRRLVIFSAGSTDLSSVSGTPTVDAITQRVIATGARVLLLSIDQRPLSDSLLAFATEFGGSHAPVISPTMLLQIMDMVSNEALDTIRAAWNLRWTNISAKIGVSPADALVEDSHVDEAACTEFTVKNSGDVPLEITTVDSESGGVTCASSLPISIPVNDSAALVLCSTPSQLGPWTAEATIRSSDCSNPMMTVRLHGEATDSNTVTLSGDYVVRPGGMVSLPLHLDHALPSVYDVRQLTFRIAYDPSLLYPDEETPLTFPEGGTAPHAVMVTQDYDAESGLARTAYSLATQPGDPPLTFGLPNTPILTLRLRSFLGRVTRTDVTLQSAAFPGNKVALGYRGTASVRLDSMCWLEQRLINASALWGTLGKNAPNPSTGQTSFTYSLTADRTVRLALYDMHGRLLRVLREGPETAGGHAAVIDTRGLAAGAYVFRLESAAGVLSRVLLVSSQKEN